VLRHREPWKKFQINKKVTKDGSSNFHFESQLTTDSNSKAVNSKYSMTFSSHDFAITALQSPVFLTRSKTVFRMLKSILD